MAACFAVDPTLAANRGIADLDQVPTTRRDWSNSQPMCCSRRRTRPARARCSLSGQPRPRQSLAIMSGARQRDLSPESGSGRSVPAGAGSRWRFSAGSSTCNHQGLTNQAPVAPVEGIVRKATSKPLRESEYRLALACARPHLAAKRAADVSNEDG